MNVLKNSLIAAQNHILGEEPSEVVERPSEYQLQLAKTYSELQMLLSFILNKPELK